MTSNGFFQNNNNNYNMNQHQGTNQQSSNNNGSPEMTMMMNNMMQQRIGHSQLLMLCQHIQSLERVVEWDLNLRLQMKNQVQSWQI